MIWPATTIVLTVSPSLNAEGRKAYSIRGQLFDGSVDGRIVVKRSTAPFCDTARALLAEGIKPDTVLVMRHASSAADALRSTVGVAAGLTVADDKLGKPIFTKWKPRPDVEGSSSGASPMRETDLAATSVPPEPRRILDVVFPDVRTVALGLDVHADAAGEMIEAYFGQEPAAEEA